MPVIDFNTYNAIVNGDLDNKPNNSRPNKKNNVVKQDEKIYKTDDLTIKKIINNFKKEKDMPLQDKKQILIKSLKKYADKYNPYKEDTDY